MRKPLLACVAIFTMSAATLAAETASAMPGGETPRVFLLEAQSLRSMRERLASGKFSNPALDTLRSDADAALKLEPLSVMQKAIVPPSGDKHDYMSQAPYWWPDPGTATGLPYIRRDGERNPEIARLPDHRNFDRVITATHDLALAYYLFGNEAYAAKASTLLRAWFLDPATRMNPNLNYGQAVRGHNEGRGIGLIETRGIVKVVDAVGLLAGSRAWTEADQKGVQDWFTAFLAWMQDSPNGKQEAAARNNHGTYYDVQVVSIALFLGNTQLARQIIREVPHKRITTQIEPDGRQPLELARTKAFSYSAGNLAGLFELARLGENVGADLWSFQTSDGRSIRKALDYLLPFATDERGWPFRQIGGVRPQPLAPLLVIAGNRYHWPQYEQAALKIDPGVVLRLNYVLAKIEQPTSAAK